LLGQEPAYQLLFLLVFNAGEEFLTEYADGISAIEREFRVLLAAIEMTGLATSFKDGLDLRGKIYRIGFVRSQVSKLPEAHGSDRRGAMLEVIASRQTDGEDEYDKQNSTSHERILLPRRAAGNGFGESAS
jgi:hypothetical protein